MIAKHDDLIRQFINDPLYDIRKDGTIWSRKAPTGKVYKDPSLWRRIDYVRDNCVSIKYQYTNLMVNRIMFQKYLGELDASQVISFKDHNQFNVIPNNLFMCTRAESNYRAFNGGGRKPVIGNKKLNRTKVETIRRLYAEGHLQIDLAKMFDVAKSTICEVVNHKTWR